MRGSLPVRGVVVVAMAMAACSFDPSGGTGAIDAPTDVADPDGSIDATDAGPDACVPNPGGELCNGVDDDCDLATDETFPTVGDPCDGADTDLCPDDVVRCATGGTATTCGDSSADNDVERCNTLDDDCDMMTDEGFTGLGAACDGADTDACAEGTGVCSGDGAVVVCSDMTSSTVEVCNGADDDCDLATDEGFTLGTACDGGDGDVCIEGVTECDPGTGGVRCSDMTATTSELCNATDDDCDLSIDETFNLATDVNNCGLCGRMCSNAFGTTACSASMCSPTCAPGAADCDGNSQNGCENRDTNPDCTTASSLGFVNGDAVGGGLSTTGFGEAAFSVQVREVAFGNNDLRASVTLQSPAGVNFDLDVTCASCAGTLASSNATGTTDTLGVRRTDRDMISDTFTIFIRVRYTSGAACGTWTLGVNGNTGGNDLTCN